MSVVISPNSPGFKRSTTKRPVGVFVGFISSDLLGGNCIALDQQVSKRRNSVLRKDSAPSAICIYTRNQHGAPRGGCLSKK